MSNGEVLNDFRGKITPETWCWLEARHRASGKTHQEIVRDCLHEMALQEITASIEMHKLLRSEGIIKEPGGR